MEHMVFIYVVVALAAIIAGYPVYYYIGLSFSRGFHRGKQEYLDNLLNECCDKESTSGTR